MDGFLCHCVSGFSSGDTLSVARIKAPDRPPGVKTRALGSAPHTNNASSSSSASKMLGSFPAGLASQAGNTKTITNKAINRNTLLVRFTV